jgi:hypothetical protein
MSATERRRAVLEGVAFGPESSEQARLRALDLLDRLDERERREWTDAPDLAEELADDPDGLARLIELADEHLFAELPAYQRRVEQWPLSMSHVVHATACAGRVSGGSGWTRMFPGCRS